MAPSHQKIIQLMKSGQIEGVWLWYSVSGSDQLFEQLVTDKLSSPTYFLASTDSAKLIVSSLDSENKFPFPTVTYQGLADIDRLLASELNQLNWPAKIFLNFSQSGGAEVDSLGYGTFQVLTKKIERLYFAASRLCPEFASAEVLIYNVLGQNTQIELERLGIAANRANELIGKTLEGIEPGMSEFDIAQLLRTIKSKTESAFCSRSGVIEEKYAWHESRCPIVLIGPNLAKGGHSEPSDFRVARGHTIYVDFGVKLQFSDGTFVSSDLQRMGYLLRPEENLAPHDVQTVFETLVEAIKLGIDAMRPGVEAHEIDQITRNYVVGKGYPNYNHATGHAIGSVAHNPGAILAPLTNHPFKAKLKLQESGVYTIEPRCQIENGGSIEEMVVVSNLGGKTLCEPQRQLILIR